jgi:hypothetical protein
MRTSKEIVVKLKQLCFYLFAAKMVLILIAVILGTGQALAAGGLPYDDFHLSTIDRSKWQGQEAVRGIVAGAVESSFTQYGAARSFFLEFNDPNAKTSIQTEITVTDITNDDANLMARIGGHFYNSIYGETNPGNGEEGEIWVQVGAYDSGAGLFGYYSILRCEDALCNEGTTLIWNDTDFGPVNLGDTHTYSVTWNWDGSDPATNTFTFSFDGTAVTTTEPLPLVAGPSKEQFKGIGVRVGGIGSPTEGGTITARFDNVLVGGIPYDDFSAPDGRIDSTNWRSAEFVRRVNNGVFESAVARWNRNGDNHLNFFDVSNITAFQADVTVKEVINVDASPIARLSSAFYNDGTPGEGRRGDILAGAQIYHDGSQLRANAWVTRCTQINCNVPGEYENLWWGYLTPDVIQIDETHTLSISWDASENKFHFGFDGSIITPDVDFPPIVANPRGRPFNGIGTRVHGIEEGEGGYIRATFDNVVLLTDFQSPLISGHNPAPGATNVAVDTDIVVHVRDDGTGVDQSTLMLRIDNATVFDGSDPGAYPNTTITGNVADYKLTYDPPTDFSNDQLVEVRIEAADLAGNTMEQQIYSFLTAPPIGNPWEPLPDDRDDDEDGIPNTVEINLLDTNPNMKTLFVRPKQFVGGVSTYWPGFIALFPDARDGFADIPAFTHAGIEVSVIGDPGHPYAPMRNFNYDPATDANHPPCDILEIFYLPDTVYCTYGSHNFGHTYFYSLSATWYWDTKGYVPNDQISAHYKKYKYFTPYIYPFPLDNYMNEGAYPQIAENAMPMETSGCELNQCYDTSHSSPLNLRDSEAAAPYTQRPDGTVEFNQITFYPDKSIESIGSQGIRYTRADVMRRTLAHEMGHALLAASEKDHCTDYQCIMYHSVVDWEMRDFGPENCVHKPGGSKDIRTPGVIHNSIH